MELEQFAGISFNQDWDLDYETPDVAIAAFREGQGDAAVSQLIVELGQLLASGKNEEELERFWTWDLGGSYAPEDDGWTYRSWFEHVITVLRSRASEDVGGAG